MISQFDLIEVLLRNPSYISSKFVIERDLIS